MTATSWPRATSQAAIEAHQEPIPGATTSFIVLTGLLFPNAAGVSVTVPIASDFETAAASSAAARRLDQVQHRRGSGPSLDAIQRAEVVEASLGEDCPWPELSSAGEADGVLGVYSSPLEAAGATLGSLTVYTRDPGLSDGERSSFVAACEHGATVLATSEELERCRAKADHLLIALESRELIGEAKGIIMAEQRCTPDEAFDALRCRSQRANRKLRDVARDMVEAYSGKAPAPPVFTSS